VDTLNVKGVGRRIDGEYPCDIAGLVDVSLDEALTVAEANFVRDFSGARGGEIVEAFLAGDMAVRSALAMVVLQRAGIPLLNETVLALKSGWAMFDLGVEQEDEAEHPPTVEGVEPSTNGGKSSSQDSVSLDDDLSRIGVPV